MVRAKSASVAIARMLLPTHQVVSGCNPVCKSAVGMRATAMVKTARAMIEMARNTKYG